MEEPRKRARSDARLEEDAPAIKRASNETETAVGAGGGAPEEAEAAGAPSAPSRYVRREKLGEGSYGMVYRGEDLDDGSTVALKYIKVGEDQDGLPPTTLREVCVLRNLHHPNVVELKDVVLDPRNRRLMLVFECLKYDVKYLLEEAAPHGLGATLAKFYGQQLFRGLAYCHGRRILHRDLKPANLLVSADGVLKLADFGLAREYTLPVRAYTHDVVTLWYRAPEVLLGSTHYDEAVDVWSAGCILYELLTGQHLFTGNCEFDQCNHIFRRFGTPAETLWKGVTHLPDFSHVFPRWPARPLELVFPHLEPQARDLIGGLLAMDPAKRLTARDALAHPFFADAPAAGHVVVPVRRPHTVTPEKNALGFDGPGVGGGAAGGGGGGGGGARAEPILMHPVPEAPAPEAKVASSASSISSAPSSSSSSSIPVTGHGR